MRQILTDYLKENGIEGKDVDNLVLFEVNGLHFICQFFPEDAYYLRLMLPQIENVDVKGVRDIIAELNARFKVAKIIEVNNNPWIVGECFVYSTQNGVMLIGRLVKLLTDVFNAYMDKRSESSAEGNDNPNSQNE